jgi:hypothetical protein
VAGVLAAADDDGITVRSGDDAGTPIERHIPYGDIERARTVFEWGPGARA